MTEVSTPTAVTPKGPGLAGRLVGVIFSPRATYQAIVANPRALAALIVTGVIACGIQFAFLSTAVGQNAMFEQQLQGMERFGFDPTPEAIQRMEDGLPRMRFTTLAFQLPAIPIIAALISGLLLVVMNAFLDGDAKFK